MRAFLVSLLAAVTLVGSAPAPVWATTPVAPAGAQVATAGPVEGDVAIRFEWKSNKPYAGQFHDIVQYKSGTNSWVRTADQAKPVNEDRVTLVFEDPARPVPGFSTQGCYVACHTDMNDMPGQTVDARHYVSPSAGLPLGSFALDMWHWRGGRSGPMGYAEDTWVRVHDSNTGAQGRVRDAATVKPTNWLNSGGDNLHENQTFGGALTWKGTPLPRFVFDKSRSGFDNYFLAEGGEAITTVDGLKNISNDAYRSQLVVYQDAAVGGNDKVNSVDVRFLLHMAGVVPDPGYRGDWHAFWSNRLGVHDAAQASALLDDIVAHVEDGVMVARVVGFIFESGQHDITSDRSFAYDPLRGTWSVTLHRALSTGGTDDVDLSALTSGTKFNFAFSVHDIVIDDGLTHHISLPLTLSNAAGSTVRAKKVASTRDVDWSAISAYNTSLYQPGTVSREFLVDDLDHPGAAGVRDGQSCASCHSVSSLRTLSLPHVPSGTASGLIPVTVRVAYSTPAPELPATIDVAGANRYDTAVKASQLAYPSGLDAAGKRTVVIATGANWPDALGGAALAGAIDGPVLLVARDSIPTQVSAELARLGADKAIVVGGESAVSAAVETSLKSALGAADVTRIKGTNRYSTAQALAQRVIAERGGEYDGRAFVATGANFPDALAAAPIAAAKGTPLFLIDPARGVTAGELSAMAGVTHAVILGGESAVSSGVESQLKAALGNDGAHRLAGTTRYTTAAKVAAYGVSLGLSWNRVGITTGTSFPDALAGGVAQGKIGSVMLLSRPDALDGAADAALREHKAHISTVTYYGGANAVSQKVRDAVSAAIQ